MGQAAPPFCICLSESKCQNPARIEMRLSPKPEEKISQTNATGPDIIVTVTAVTHIL